MNSTWIIKAGQLVDPAGGRNAISDLYIQDGVICDSPPPENANASVIDACGLVVVPGLIDLHVHFREPGKEKAETIESGSSAAARGGFTTAVAMPNTSPAIDSPERVQDILKLSLNAGTLRLLPSACLSMNRGGMEATDLAALARSGAVAFTDDGTTVMDESIMLAQLTKAAELGLPVMDHALDTKQAGNGVMRNSALSEAHGMPGIPEEAEVDIVARDIRLAEQSGCHVHIQHLSCAKSASLIRDASRKGIPVTAEVTPHHLSLCLDDIDIEDADFKMNPPLGTSADRMALLKAISSGDITCFATDHAPHLDSDKKSGFLDAPFGVVGLETAVGVTYTAAVLSGHLSLEDWVRRWTEGPASVLGIPAPTLLAGTTADIALLDLESSWDVSPSHFLSKSANTPFKGASLTGKCMMTLMGGIRTWSDSSDSRFGHLAKTP